jgi:hypothetical protein
VEDNDDKSDKYEKNEKGNVKRRGTDRGELNERRRT